MADDARPPVAIRITRPYATEQEYLERELETLTRTGVTLIGAQPRPEGALLRFELALASGQVLVRGEGRVTGYKAAALQGSGGLALRFTRLDLRSKALIDRAAAMRESRRSALAGPNSEIASRPGSPSSAPSLPPPPVRTGPRDAGSPPMPRLTLPAMSPTLPPPPFAAAGAPTVRPDSMPPPLPGTARSSPAARSNSQPPPWPARVRHTATPAPPREPPPAAARDAGGHLGEQARAGAPARSVSVDSGAAAGRSVPHRDELLERLRLRARRLDDTTVRRILAPRRPG